MDADVHGCEFARMPQLGGLSLLVSAVPHLILAFFTLGLSVNAFALGDPRIVDSGPSAGSFDLVSGGVSAEIQVDPHDWPGVLRAVSDLRSDIQAVTGCSPELRQGENARGRNVVIIGTLGKNALLDKLARERKIDLASVAGRWEATLIQTVRRPFPGVEKALVIAGSDKRGTIFGIYELSEQCGVSPWYWWADVPAKHHDALYVRAGQHVLGPPAVKYRGIFINDEGPCLMTWARKRYGELNHQMYTNVFELILRLKGNFLWPAMWDNSFASDDPLNAKLADEYGVVMGTSHHEPMMRAWKEWSRAGNPKGSWDYARNEEKLRAFWAEGLRRTKDYEKVVTLGMRGDGDEPMSEKDSVALLERIVRDQRQMIGQLLNTNLNEVPQVWALYKEVQGYYERGMRVPPDVTLLWCDDNWGNLRRLPTPEEQLRPGGAGIYYHLDYVGGPRNYKWLNTVPLPKIWEQMNLALQYKADRLWVVNVGDIKPEEVPLEFFLAMAWNPRRWTQDRLDEYLRLWAEREFGPKYAVDIADIVAKYAKYNGRRKPELLEPGTFSLENYHEAERVSTEWQGITDKAERIYAELPKELRDAYYELVLYPTKASAVVNQLYIAAARNRFYARRGDARANEFATQARDLFREDAALSSYYNHELAGGKWNHMMDQTHIGYRSWQEPKSNSLPALLEPGAGEPNVQTAAAASFKQPLSTPPPANWHGFVEQDGCVAIEAEHFSKNVKSGSARWVPLPDHGRTVSAMTIFPVTAMSVAPPSSSPRLEYDMWLSSTGAVKVELVFSPSLNFAPARGVRIGVSFDKEAPRTLTLVPKGYNAGDGNHDWEECVKNSVRIVTANEQLKTAGAHTLKVWMIDPGVVLQRLIVNAGGERPSYLGPPESPHPGAQARNN